MLDLGCDRVPVPRHPLRDPGIDPPFGLLDEAELRRAPDHRLERRSRYHRNVGSRIKELLVAAVAQDEAIVGIIESKAFVDAFDRIDQPLPSVGDLTQVLLLDLDCCVSEDGESLRHLPDLVFPVCGKGARRLPPAIASMLLLRALQPRNEIAIDV